VSFRPAGTRIALLLLTPRGKGAGTGNRRARHDRRSSRVQAGHPHDVEPAPEGTGRRPDPAFSKRAAARLHAAALPCPGRLFRDGLRRQHDRPAHGDQQEPVRHHGARRLRPRRAEHPLGCGPALPVCEAGPLRRRKPHPRDDLPVVGHRDGRGLRDPFGEGVSRPGRLGAQHPDPAAGRPLHLRHVHAVFRSDGAAAGQGHPQAPGPAHGPAARRHAHAARPVRRLGLPAGAQPQGGAGRAARLSRDALDGAAGHRAAAAAGPRVPGAAVALRIRAAVGGARVHLGRPQPPAPHQRPQERPAAFRDPDPDRRKPEVQKRGRAAAGGAVPGGSARPHGGGEAPAPAAAARVRAGEQRPAPQAGAQDPGRGDRGRLLGHAGLQRAGGRPEAARAAGPDLRGERPAQGPPQPRGQAAGRGVPLPGR
jgi:hypothetical protein